MNEVHGHLMNQRNCPELLEGQRYTFYFNNLPVSDCVQIGTLRSCRLEPIMVVSCDELGQSVDIGRASSHVRQLPGFPEVAPLMETKTTEAKAQRRAPTMTTSSPSTGHMSTVRRRTPVFTQRQGTERQVPESIVNLADEESYVHRQRALFRISGPVRQQAPALDNPLQVRLLL